MKRLIPILFLVVSVSLSHGAWDIELTSGFYGSQNLTGSQRLLMTGGWTPQIWGQDTSYIEVHNTDTQGISTLLLDDNSDALFQGGFLNALNIYDDATIILSGGSINSINSYQRPLSGDYPPSYWDKHIEVICKTYDYNTSTKKLTGVWGNDTTFNIQLVDKSGYYSAFSNIEFTIIPEPATLSLLGLGAFLIRRKK